MKTLSMLLIPRITDKAFVMSKKNQYVFNVPIDANKHDIASGVAKQYGVTVNDVNITVSKGKMKRVYRRGKAQTSKRSDTKKAYVTLAEGQSIKVFEEEQ